MRKWILTDEDFKNARILYEEEKIHPVNEENMFRAGLYCILSSAENFKKQKSIYDEFLETKLDRPESIKGDKEKFKQIIKKTRFPNRKEKYVWSFAVWWPESDIPRKILDDIGDGREKEYEIRNEFAENAPGISYKCSSLFMIKCGYENVVPLDVWILRFLHDRGHDVKVPDYKTVSGVTDKEYLKYEKIVCEIAEELEISPALFQCALWSKYSTWKK